MKKKAVIAYRCEKDIPGGAGEGEVVHLSEEDAQPLVEAGYLSEADAADLGDKDDEEEDMKDDTEEDTPDLQQNTRVARSLAGLEKRMEKRMAQFGEQLAKQLSKAQPKQTLSGLGNVEPTDRKAGFKHFADWVRCGVKGYRGDPTCRRKMQQSNLQVKTILGQGEDSGADGLYSVPPEFSDELWDKVRLDYTLSDMLTKEPVMGNTRNKPGFAESSLADGSEYGGLQSFWTGEGAALTASKAQLQQVQYILQKLTVLNYETNELLADDYKYDFSGLLQKAIAIVMRRKLNDAVINGSGSGQPKGFTNEPSLITVTHDSADSAPVKLVYNDLANMYQRMYLPSQRSKNAVWIAHQAYQADLMQMVFPSGSGTFPAHGITYNAADEFEWRIFGKPVMFVEEAPAPGAVGSFLFVDPSQTYMIEKPIQIDFSTEFQFATDQFALRCVYRMDAKSNWQSALTPRYGSSSHTTSPYIALSAVSGVS